MRTMIPRKWMASEATKKYLWFLTQSFKATKLHKARKAPRKILTFIDCPLTHWNRTFTEAFLFLPMVSTLHKQEQDWKEESKIGMGEQTRTQNLYVSLFCFGLVFVWRLKTVWAFRRAIGHAIGRVRCGVYIVGNGRTNGKETRWIWIFKDNVFGFPELTVWVFSLFCGCSICYGILGFYLVFIFLINLVLARMRKNRWSPSCICINVI